MTTPWEVDNRELLTHCPACAYQLEGLPALHTCPECGLAIDRRWKVFGGQSRRLIRSDRVRTGWIVLCVLSLIVCACAMVTDIASQNRYGWLKQLVPVSALVVSLWTTVRRRDAFVAVGPDGICMYRDREHVDCCGFDQVTSSPEALAKGMLSVKIGICPQLVDSETYFRSSARLAKACCHEIGMYMGTACDAETR